ncbi:outer membrane protein [Winogradskyella thalassocola]|uniref:Opacity protein n=1 Tax=Winogradskyella thalassocola TaxID=262004 RepID=A0A1G8ESM0_9FLAO|nr:outer membrane beta-barrel protein [Winogradskyella thalassocola]SDH72865.1 Opacity protein [Winogradskyella thalassocola]
MFRKIALFIIGLVSIVGYSQDSKLNVELSYPIVVDDNFVGRNYNGIVDLGLKYRFLALNAIHIGGSFHVGYLKNSKTERVQPIDVNLFTIQPRIFAELHIPSLPKFYPSVGLGYSVFVFKPVNNQPSLNPNTTYESENESGFNINLGIAYDISRKVLIQIQYDFVKFGIDNDVPDITYNSNINILKIGLGYRL